MSEMSRTEWLSRVHDQRGRLNETKRILVASALDDSIKKQGIFRFIDWGLRERGERAFQEAQKYFRSIKPENFGPDQLRRYLSYAQAVYEQPNVGITAGLDVALKCAAGLFTGISTNTLQIGTAAVFGGPASYQTSANNKGFLGVGSGIVYATLNGAVSAGATSIVINTPTQNTTSTNFAANDVIIFQDSTTLNAQGTNVETALVTSGYAGGGALTIPLTLPIRYAHSNATYVIKAGNKALADMIATSNRTYKGIDASFPTESNASGAATLTWQATYATAEGQYAWYEACIGAVPNASSPPNAGSGASGVTTIPGSSVLLAASAWYPLPLTKGASVISQQYSFSVS